MQYYWEDDRFLCDEEAETGVEFRLDFDYEPQESLCKEHYIVCSLHWEYFQTYKMKNISPALLDETICIFMNDKINLPN